MKKSIELNQTLLSINNGEYSESQLVSILELVTHNLNLDTISEMARKEDKSPRGIRTSNRYRKIKIGKQLFAIKGLEDTNLPF